MGISRKEFFEQTKESNIKKEDEFDREINEIVLTIIKRRKEKHMTQEELAKKAGITKNTVSRMETLTNDPTLKILLKICKALDLKFKVK